MEVIAIRMVVHRTKNPPCDQKILIAFSNCKPIDSHGLPLGKYNPDQFIYANAPGAMTSPGRCAKAGRRDYSLCAS